MDLFSDLKRITQEQLTALGIVFDASADLQDLLLLALNHDLKTVRPVPRKVHCSTEFMAKRAQLDAQAENAVAEIIAKFEAGQDVNGHLSKSSIKAEETDALLADWKIHHLHISNHKKNPADKFYARTGPVMFAQILDDSVYFIDIYPHGKGFPEAWTRQDMLKIVDAEWPHLLDSHRLKGITALEFKPTDLGLKTLRGGYVNAILQVGESFIAPPGGGLATDGTPSENVTRMDRTLHLIRDFEEWVNTNSPKLKAAIAAQSGLAEADLDFELVALDPIGWGIVEKRTRLLVAEYP